MVTLVQAALYPSQRVRDGEGRESREAFFHLKDALWTLQCHPAAWYLSLPKYQQCRQLAKGIFLGGGDDISITSCYGPWCTQRRYKIDKYWGEYMCGRDELSGQVTVEETDCVGLVAHT